MNRKIARAAGTVMLLAALCFLLYALNHPEGHFPWPGWVTCVFYAAWAAAAILLLIAPFGKK